MNNSAINHIICIIGHLGARRKKQLAYLIFYISIASIFDLVSIGMVLPYLKALSNIKLVNDYPLLEKLLLFIGIESSGEIALLLSIAFSVLICISLAMRSFSLWAILKFSYACGSELSEKIFNKILIQPYAFHLQNNSSQIIDATVIKTTDVIGLIALVLNLFASATTIVIALSFILYIHPYAALGIFAVIGSAYLLIAQFIRRKLMTISNVIFKKSPRLLQIVQESLESIRDIKLGNTEHFYSKGFAKVDYELRRTQGDKQFFGQMPKLVMELLGMLVIVVITYYTFQNNESFADIAPLLGLVSVAAYKLMPVFQMGYFAWSNLTSSKLNIQDFIGLLSLKERKVESRGDVIKQFTSQITLADVGYQYFKSPNLALSNINVTIKKGDKIGIIGKTGSGKSTLIDLVLGLLEPSIGSIEVDGIVLNSGNTSSWMKLITHVPQHSYLIDGTIKENVAFGVEPGKICDRRVKQALVAAQIFDYVENLPSGIYTMVGEGGSRLSGGQRQRIGIARSFYKESEFIVLDECTSALDDETEANVMHEIYKLENATALVISHKYKTLYGCSHIYEVANGTLIYIGGFKDLINYKSVYH